MTLIGPSAYTRLDLPDVRPAPRLDQHTLADSGAREDALLGALAVRSAAEEAAQRNADPDQPPLTRREIRDLEDKWAAHWNDYAQTPHEQQDAVDYARIVACRNTRGGES